VSRARNYEDIADRIREVIQTEGYAPGDRLMTERKFSEIFGVSRSLVREAILLLEIEGLVEVRKGSGTYLVSDPAPRSASEADRDDIGPFELLQARQLVESEIAAFAARMVTKTDIVRMREALALERADLTSGTPDYAGDRQFHRLIAEGTQNSVLVDVVEDLWRKREQSPMWARLQTRIFESDYRLAWLDDHQAILSALAARNPEAARAAMWQHLENVREILMALSDVDDPEFDGKLFQPIARQG
jgi:GntR family transcriptional regulator, uxu operon transcriptional repressor